MNHSDLLQTASARALVRREVPSDHGRVDAIHEAAFGRPAEARLVRALREGVRPQVSLVAEVGREVVGHVFVSPVSIEGSGSALAAGGLAPLGVAPQAQGRGVGTVLVRAGLRESRSLGWRAVFLLGEPEYYSRFGFVLAAPEGFHYESEAFDAAFQVVELAAGALAGCRGWVRYPEPFARV